MNKKNRGHARPKVAGASPTLTRLLSSAAGMNELDALYALWAKGRLKDAECEVMILTAVILFSKPSTLPHPGKKR